MFVCSTVVGTRSEFMYFMTFRQKHLQKSVWDVGVCFFVRWKRDGCSSWHLQGRDWASGARFFTAVHSEWARDCGWKLKEEKSKLKLRKLFPLGTARQWCRLSMEAVLASSLEISNLWQGTTLSSLIWAQLSAQCEAALETSWLPSHLGFPVIPCWQLWEEQGLPI